MKKSINIWAFPNEKPFSGRWHGSALAACMKEAKEAGFEAIELALSPEGELTPKTSRAACTALRRAAEDLGIEIASLAAGLMWGCPVTADSPKLRRQGRDVVKRALERAAWLGAGCVLVIPGLVGADFIPGAQPVRYDVAYNRALEAWQDLAPLAEQHQVALGLENVWNKFLLSPLEMRDLVDKINSPYVGVYFDVGNVVLTGYPEHWIEILNTRIKRVHLKDFRRNVGNLDGFVMLLEGNVNYPAVMKALRAVGYDGPLTVEYMPSSPGLLKKAAAALDEILKM